MHDAELQAILDANRREYGNVYRVMDFIEDDEAAALTAERAALLAEIAALGGTTLCGGTKLDGRDQSPGCTKCAEGRWSCLFINNLCNASCFYCPAPQQEISEPGSNRITFSTPEDFAAYLTRFQFTGASVSGGEPFTTFDRTIAYLQAARAALGPAGHLWLYTNGKLADEGKLRRLADLGLDEIRVDIGAVDYDLSKVALAVPLIPRVTVEIPAVPDELVRLLELPAALAAIGVRHLNLHQLRATPHSVGNLIERGVRLQHGPKVLAARSEVTALSVIAHSLRNNIRLPINYCSFVYKSSHQQAAARRRAATEVLGPDEQITDSGFIRQRRDGRIRYFAASIEPGTGPGTVTLPSGAALHIDRRPVVELALHGDHERDWESLRSAGIVPDGAAWATIRDCERLPAGLYPYF